MTASTCCAGAFFLPKGANGTFGLCKGANGTTIALGFGLYDGWERGGVKLPAKKVVPKGSLVRKAKTFRNSPDLMFFAWGVRGVASLDH
jgi:hypothetical protein